MKTGIPAVPSADKTTAAMPHHKTGTARNQMSFGSLDDQIAPDNPVRILDAFVDMLDLGTFGFQHIRPKEKGAPSFHPSVLLKLYFYGYFNRIRSSRKLEKECERNMEMRWLCEGQAPCYHTIATFRTFKDEKANINHRKALKEVFRAFNRFLAGEGLFGKETVAADGTKVRAQNARKKNYTEDKLKKKLEMADQGIEEYLGKLDRADLTEKGDASVLEEKALVAEKLAELRERKARYEGLRKELEERQEKDPSVTQISLTDPEARSMVVNNSGHAEISYNTVTAVDGKHCLIAHYSTENTKDDNLLAGTMTAVKAEFDTGFAAVLEGKTEDNLNKEAQLTGLADKGFHAGDQLALCREHSITTYVAMPQPAYSGKDKMFTKENFDYEKDGDVYVCPAGEELATNGTWYGKKDRHGQVANRFKRYTCPYGTCAACRFNAPCLSRNSLAERHGRILERSEHEEAVEENRRRMESKAGRERYKRRQAIVEHPFGTIKRSWGCYYTLLKGKEKVTGEYALVFLCYNMRRAMNILGIAVLLERIKGAGKLFLSFFGAFRGLLAGLLFGTSGFLVFQAANYRSGAAIESGVGRFYQNEITGKRGW